MRYLSFVAFVLPILLSGCQVTTIAISAPYNDEYTAAQIAPTGTNTVKGSALIRQSGGGVVTCAGSVVDIIPVTTYSSERIQAIYGNTTKGYVDINKMQWLKLTPEPPIEYRERSRKVVCDAQGYFKFENLKDGVYFVGTRISWSVGSMLQGGVLNQKIELKNGETKDIVLSP